MNQGSGNGRITPPLSAIITFRSPICFFNAATVSVIKCAGVQSWLHPQILTENYLVFFCLQWNDKLPDETANHKMVLPCSILLKCGNRNTIRSCQQFKTCRQFQYRVGMAHPDLRSSGTSFSKTSSSLSVCNARPYSRLLLFSTFPPNCLAVSCAP